jgi:hypothetical protein
VQDIDPVLFVGPLVYIAFSSFLVAYWHYRRRLTAIILFLSAVAYFAAIGLKVLVQSFTYGWIQPTFGTVSIPTGLYFGLQTTFFEIGLAYLVARFAVSRGKIDARDGEGYGVSLAFWENGVLIGALTLLSLVFVYVLIADGLLSQSLYQSIVSSDPSYFYPPSQLLYPTAFGILERLSSLLFHFSWGYLCVLAAYLHKRNYLLLALPMGLVDALVPFAGELPLWVFETGLFLVALGAFAITWKVTEKDRRSGYAKELTPGPPVGTP